MKTIIYTLSAGKDLDVLPRYVRGQIEAYLEACALTGRGDVKALSGRDGFRHRVVFDEDQITILAIYIGKRETPERTGGTSRRRLENDEPCVKSRLL